MKKRTKVSAEFSMSSLTDIIFLLLIFFMLTSSMVVPNALNLQLPGSKQSRPSQPTTTSPPTVTINDNGTYLLDGAPSKRSTIERKIRDEKKALRNSGSKRTLSVIDKPGANAPNESVVAILDMAFRYKINAVMTDSK